MNPPYMEPGSTKKKWWLWVGVYLTCWTALALLASFQTYLIQLRWDKPVSWTLAMRRSAEEYRKALEEKGTGSIDITEFVDAETVDRMYMDRVYFLGPEKGGDRAFALLGEALKKTRKVAIGQWAARGKQYLIMIRPLGPGLAMEQLRYANEVRSIDEVPIPKVDVKKAEVDLAVQLIQQAASEAFQPTKYEDTVKKRILEQIERKVEGKEITEEPTEAPKTQIIDLMEALKASLAKGKGAAGAERKPAKRAEAAAKPAKTRQVKRKAASA